MSVYYFKLLRSLVSKIRNAIRHFKCWLSLINSMVSTSKLNHFEYQLKFSPFPSWHYEKLIFTD